MIILPIVNGVVNYLNDVARPLANDANSIIPKVSATPGLTPTMTRTATVTPTITRTPTITPSITPTLTVSVTPSPSVTPTPAPSNTPTITPSITISSSQSIAQQSLQWLPAAASAANNWRSVTYGNGLFVAVSDNGTNRVMTSPDGINWTSRVAVEATFWIS